MARNAGIQAVANPKKELVKVNKDGGYSLIRPADVLLASEQCVDITVSANTSDTYKPHAVGKVVNIRAEEKIIRRTARRAYRMVNSLCLGLLWYHPQ